MARLTISEELLEYRTMGLGSEMVRLPRTPRVCLGCEHPCEYYGDPNWADVCQEDLDSRDSHEHERERGLG